MATCPACGYIRMTNRPSCASCGHTLNEATPTSPHFALGAL